MCNQIIVALVSSTKVPCMNDNQALFFWQHQLGWLDARRTKQISDLSEVAQRAVLKPESLTMGEIQEVGWGFLLMASERANKVPLPN